MLCEILLILPSAILFTYLEHPRNIEAELHLALCPVVDGFGKKYTFVHTGGICHMELEHMTSGFNIKTDRKRVMKSPGFVLVDHIIIIQVQRNALAETQAATHAGGINIIVISERRYQVAVEHGRHQLQAQSVAELSARDQLAIIRKARRK